MTPCWPVALVTGFLGSGKTTLLRALLARDGMADTMVVVNEFGAVGIDHDLIAAVHGDVVLLRGGCLCCGVRQDLARTLRDLRRRWLAGTVPQFARVVVETSGLADPGPVVAAIGANPLLQDAYRVRSVTTVLDAEHAAGQLAAQPVVRRQVAAADRLLIAKPDRSSEAARAELAVRLRAINPFAAIAPSLWGDAAAADLFAAGGPPMPARRWADAVPGHAGEVACVSLRGERPLRFDRLQRWLADLLEVAGERLLRLKGVLDIEGSAVPVVLQAVHHTVYPLDTLPAWPGVPASALVLIFDGAPPTGLEAGFAATSA